MMYKDAYRHTFLGIQLASGPRLGTGDHVSFCPDLVECNAASRCVEAVCPALTIARAIVRSCALV